MAKFKTDEIDEGTLEGYITIGGIEIEANLDLENDEAKTVDDFKDLILQTERFADYFTDEKQLDLKQAISKEIVGLAFEQDEYKPTDEDYLNLQNDLELFDLYTFYGGFVLTFSAKNNFPCCDVVVQIDEDGTIDDIAVYDSDEFDDDEFDEE
ncbi:MAG: hypothetical protein LBL90_03200 [Prevotellaceae bacterium]|nr:hypothetical protein [Prevotellaceae bacterium]